MNLNISCSLTSIKHTSYPTPPHYQSLSSTYHPPSSKLHLSSSPSYQAPTPSPFPPFPFLPSLPPFSSPFPFAGSSHYLDPFSPFPGSCTRCLSLLPPASISRWPARCARFFSVCAVRPAESFCVDVLVVGGRGGGGGGGMR